MQKTISSCAFLCGTVVAASTCSLYADSIELVNGDLLNGKVVSLDDRELRLVSEIHGPVSITRDKVAAITLGDRKLSRPAAVIGPADSNGEAQAVVRRSLPASGKAPAGAAVQVPPGAAGEVMRQLRSQGLSAENINELQKAFPLLKEPGPKKYFDETVQGLIKGDINVDDVRKDAVRVRDELRKTAKSLGPEGEKTLNQALGGYLQILDNFIRETEPKAANEAQKSPADDAATKDATEAAKKETPSGASKQAEKSQPRR